MALEIYTQQDILNVLRATLVAGEGSAALALDVLGDQAVQATPDRAGVPVEGQALAEELLQMYRRGFCTALSSVALAFGLSPIIHTCEPGQGSETVACRREILRCAQNDS